MKTEKIAEKIKALISKLELNPETDKAFVCLTLYQGKDKSTPGTMISSVQGDTDVLSIMIDKVEEQCNDLRMKFAADMHCKKLFSNLIDAADSEHEKAIILKALMFHLSKSSEEDGYSVKVQAVKKPVDEAAICDEELNKILKNITKGDA
jgi:hypothetical protein